MANITEKTIMDYIIDQAEIYDGANLHIEQDIIDKILKLYDNMADQILDTAYIHGDIDSILKYQTLINRLQGIVEVFYSEVYKLLTSKSADHMNKGYSEFDDLINIGYEMEQKLIHEKVTEIGKTPDPEAVEFMRKHAFEQVTGMANGLLTNMKTKLGELVARGVYDKKVIQEELTNILGVTRSRAEMIAQTEMSMAYNNGALARMEEFNRLSPDKLMRKYWHGFKYSERTCTFCRPHIGIDYPYDDNTVTLPAHPRCRCIWLPFMTGWATPVSRDITRNADMLKRVVSPEQVYDRINKRLGINYAQYLKTEDALRYMAGDRTQDILNALGDAHNIAVKQTIDDFNIATNLADVKMAKEFNIQMRFWKKYTAEAMVSNKIDTLRKSYEAIKGVMVLPWNGEQLKEWNNLLEIIDKYL